MSLDEPPVTHLDSQVTAVCLIWRHRYQLPPRRRRVAQEILTKRMEEGLHQEIEPLTQWNVSNTIPQVSPMKHREQDFGSGASDASKDRVY